MGGRRICPAAKTALSAFLVITHGWPLSSVDSSLQNFVPLFPFPFYLHCSTPSVHSLSRDHCRTPLTQCPHLYKSSLIMSLSIPVLTNLWWLPVDQGNQVQLPLQGHLQHGLFNDKAHIPTPLCLCSCYSFRLEIWCSPLLPAGTLLFVPQSPA